MHAERELWLKSVLSSDILEITHAIIAAAAAADVEILLTLVECPIENY